ncbi:hypothetical protein GCM10025760_12310 [Microbacterium yannicii]|uniref:DUF4430 domain-containing protein n=1 Tax=Microbacterium yannicii TaxID=671622 RepID=A0ABP9M4C8_9MICO|nr:hypothetical protein [Microbacterium yannicii]MCO5954668.1 hypothetical protein [Microbacterium yannicii]
MTPTLRSVAAASASAALLLALVACSGTPDAAPTPAETKTVAILDSACADDAGITVAVDASALEDGDSKEWCIGTEEPLAASDALTLVNVTTEGTDEYGDEVVCRVNGVPAENAAIPAADGSEYFEKCESMAPAFAYWGLWVKPAGGEWDYAQEGISTLELQPGESLALLFTLNGEPAAPTT